MNRTPPKNPEPNPETLRLSQANGDADELLRKALQDLRTVLRDEWLRQETPIEVWLPLESAAEAIGAALRRLEAKGPQTAPSSGGPTQRQGQFLAYIREYLLRNYLGLAPTHADLQRFFNLTPPSVNSMLIRLEQRGFIRRTPGVARAIELCIDPDLIPPLEQPFKF